MSLLAVLERGYFPKELPRPFVTKSFAMLIASTVTLPAGFGSSASEAKKNKLRSGKSVRYSHARGGQLLRRPLSICNPLHYYLLANEIVKNWPALSKKVSGTLLSATTPEFKTNGRAINGKWSQSARSELAINNRIGRRFILQTDISRFYHSIYTHSIPWALHTKSVSKINHSFNLLGNELDYWVRMGQDQQTIGIPIGPDTSLVISEIIMQRCDEFLLNKMPNLKGHRFIDDYELAFQTRNEAEDAFHILESCLFDYELALNPKKTNIIELPTSLEASWVIELKSCNFRLSAAGQSADLHRYFDLAFSLHKKYPNESVFQFAIARLRSVIIFPKNWELFQKLLLLCVVPEPASLPYVLEQIIRRTNSGAIPIRSELEEIMNTLICIHAEMKHSSELANAVWACLAFGLIIHDKAVDLLSKCDDSVVALLTLDCEQNNLLSKQLDKSLWQSHMSTDELYGEHWLLAYEANIKGWLPSNGGVDHVLADANFAFLKTNNVFFYDQSLAMPVSPALVPLPSLPTMSLNSVYSP